MQTKEERRAYIREAVRAWRRTAQGIAVTAAYNALPDVRARKLACAKAWRAAHPEKVKAYYQAHKQEQMARQRVKRLERRISRPEGIRRAEVDRHLAKPVAVDVDLDRCAGQQ